MCAISRQNSANTELLLDKGADVNHRAADGANPICLAARYCNVLFTKSLLDRGARVNVTGDDDLTPLAEAAGANDVANIDLLLKAGAKINECGPLYKLTPLMNAAKFGGVDAVEELLHRGADPNLKSARGETAYDIAVRQGNSEVADILEPVTTDHE
jgi:ankyrin repeat protein